VAVIVHVARWNDDWRNAMSGTLRQPGLRLLVGLGAVAPLACTGVATGKTDGAGSTNVGSVVFRFE